ncbi:MAG: ACT domain-containing protein, partial [Actinomycetota bacterium]
MTSDQPVSLQTAEPRQPRIAFEKERGVSAVTSLGCYAYLTILRETVEQRPGLELEVYGALSERNISINLVKLHRSGLSFVVNEDEEQAARTALAHLGLPITSVSPVSMVSVYAAGMRLLHGVMARIAGALLEAGIPIVQTGDGPDTVFCLVEAGSADAAVAALCAEFNVAPKQAPIVVQKFGGKSVGTAEARALAAERVKEAIDEGYRPVVVVSAIGRRGEPYATDTLLGHLDAVDPGTEPSPRERDMLMACGEIISTVIMAQTLKARGLRAVALTGAQAGILTDFSYGDAQIVDIDPT